MEADNQGLRYNEGKPRWDLLPFDALDRLAGHYELGAKKYAERNWERGMDWSKCIASLLRHISSFAQGEDVDPENGALHTDAIMWNAVALSTYQIRGIGVDDRVKPGRQAKAADAPQEPHQEGPRDPEVSGAKPWEGEG